MTQFLEVMGLTQNKIFFQIKIDYILERQAIFMFFPKDTIQIIIKIVNKKVRSHKTPKIDKHLISPYNITPESNIMVTRIN